MLDPGKIFDGRRQVVFLQPVDRTFDLVDHELDPQFSDLVLDNEQHFVMMRRVAQRLLSTEQCVQPQIGCVVIVSVQIFVNCRFELTLIHIVAFDMA